VFEVKGLPTMILADHEGRILRRFVGWSSSDGAALITEAKRAIRKAGKAEGGS